MNTNTYNNKAGKIRKIISALIAAATVATAGVSTAAATTVTASAAATSAPNLYGAAYTTENPYARLNLYGQCTWYVWGRVREVTGIALNPYSNANTWANSARADGLTVSATPRANSVIVWGANAKTAYGHVGFVESVSGEYITFSHANWGNAVYGNAYTPAAGAAQYRGTVTVKQSDIAAQFGSVPAGYIYAGSAPAPKPAPVTPKADTTAPFITMGYGCNLTKSGFTAGFNVYDNVYDLSKFTITVNGVSHNANIAGNGKDKTAYVSINGSDGTYTVDGYAADTSGNVASHRVIVRISNGKVTNEQKLW